MVSIPAVTPPAGRHMSVRKQTGYSMRGDSDSSDEDEGEKIL